MTNNKRTKKALLNSVISLILCFVMFIGTTYAWFTDSVTSGINVIHVGSLDVELLHTNGYVEDEFVKETTPLFCDEQGDPIIWEPGVVAWENMTVANVGDLALKYTLSINVDTESENYLIGDDGNEYRLSDILQVAVVDDVENYATRDDILKDTSLQWMSLDSFEESGILREVGSLLPGNGETVDEDTASDTYGIIICWKPGVNDNNWNVSNNKVVSDYAETGNNYLHVDLGINLFATQYEFESDSFGPDYDAEAWENAWIERNEGAASVEISNANEMFAFAAAVKSGNDFDGKTVVLTDNIDLGGMEWIPIDGFENTFDGKNYTISQLSASLFDTLGGTVQNLTVDGAAISASENVAVIARATASDAVINNVHVKNASIIGNKNVAGIVGNMGGTVTYCTVENSTITATIDSLTRDAGKGVGAGSIVGFANENAVKISNNTASNVIIRGYGELGGIVGTADASIVTDNMTKDITIYVEKTGDIETAGEIVGKNLSGEISDNTHENIEIIDLNIIVIASTDELIAFASDVNSGNNYEGEKVVLKSSIDLGNMDWTPINGFAGIFDGQNYMISNFTVNTEGAAGLFVNLSGTVQNLTVDNADITGVDGVAVVAGSTTSNAVIHNVVVTNSVVRGHCNLGEIVGNGTVTDSTSENVEIINLGKVSIKSVDDLLAFAAQVKAGETFEGRNVCLEADIDMKGVEWTPIDGFVGCFDGQGNTISNLTVNTEGAAGLFVNLSGTVQNLTVDGATVRGQNGVAVIAGTVASDAVISNVHVTNSIVAGNDNLAEIAANTSIDATSSHENVTIIDLDVSTVIATADEMFAFAESVNVDGKNYSGKTVYVISDIDLQNKAWTPIGQTGITKAQFAGTFDGLGHTIRNLSISADTDKTNGQTKYYATAMFGFNEGKYTIKNLNIDTAKVDGYHYTAVIAGYHSGTITGCTVTNATVTCTHKALDVTCGDKAGVIIGYSNGGTVYGNTVKNSNVTAARDGGQVAGAASTSQVYGNTIENVTVKGNTPLICRLSAILQGVNINQREIGWQL